MNQNNNVFNVGSTLYGEKLDNIEQYNVLHNKGITILKEMLKNIRANAANYSYKIFAIYNEYRKPDVVQEKINKFLNILE
jgi:hypothetical protein